MKVDCNKQCNCCPATICEKRGNYIDAGATNEINKKYIRNDIANVLYYLDPKIRSRVQEMIFLRENKCESENNKKNKIIMKSKELKVQIPEGFEIDKENSTLEHIKFKPIKKDITYNDMCNILFAENQWCFYITTDGGIRANVVDSITSSEKNNSTNEKQLKKILALNQLLNIAEYYNKSHVKCDKYYTILYDYHNKYITAEVSPFYSFGIKPIFNRMEDVQAVIDNPGFQEILDTVYKS